MKLSVKNSRLVLCVLALISAYFWGEAFAQTPPVPDYQLFYPAYQKIMNKNTKGNRLTIRNAQPGATITVYGEKRNGGLSENPFYVGKINPDGTISIFLPDPPPPGLGYSYFQVEIGGQTFSSLIRTNGIKNDEWFPINKPPVPRGPGGALQKLNGLPFDFSASVCLASLDDSDVWDSLDLANLSATETYAFLSLSVYQNLSSEFFDASAFDSGEAIATGTLSFDAYADGQTADLGSQTVAAEALDIAQDGAIVSQDSAIVDSPVLIGPSTGDEESAIALGLYTAEPDSYDLVIGTAAPMLDDDSLGESVYFAFAHECQVEADTTGANATFVFAQEGVQPTASVQTDQACALDDMACVTRLAEQEPNLIELQAEIAEYEETLTTLASEFTATLQLLDTWLLEMSQQNANYPSLQKQPTAERPDHILASISPPKPPTQEQRHELRKRIDSLRGECLRIVQDWEVHSVAFQLSQMDVIGPLRDDASEYLKKLNNFKGGMTFKTTLLAAILAAQVSLDESERRGSLAVESINEARFKFLDSKFRLDEAYGATYNLDSLFPAQFLLIVADGHSDDAIARLRLALQQVKEGVMARNIAKILLDLVKATLG